MVRDIILCSLLKIFPGMYNMMKNTILYFQYIYWYVQNDVYNAIENRPVFAL